MGFNKIVKKIVLVVLGIVGALFIGCCVLFVYFFCMFGQFMPISLESIENIKIEKENRDACLDSAKTWMLETYGDVIYKIISIKAIYTYNYTDIGMPTMYLPKTVIKYSTPFYKNAKLVVDSLNYNVSSCDMKLLEDYNFRRVYSKWLKQKLGINDDGLVFYCKKDYIIDYTEIKSLENLNENICSTIRNVMINEIEINNYEYSTINELMDYVIFVLNSILESCPEIIGDGCRFVVNTLNEDIYFIHYIKDNCELRWYKNSWTKQDSINIYKIPSYKNR